MGEHANTGEPGVEITIVVEEGCTGPRGSRGWSSTKLDWERGVASVNIPLCPMSLAKPSPAWYCSKAIKHTANHVPLRATRINQDMG